MLLFLFIKVFGTTEKMKCSPNKVVTQLYKQGLTTKQQNTLNVLLNPKR